MSQNNQNLKESQDLCVADLYMNILGEIQNNKVCDSKTKQIGFWNKNDSK